MSKDLQGLGKGLNKDVNQEFQPETTYRFMLNGLFESLDGEMGGVVNERGTEISINLPTNINEPNLVGFCLLPNQDKVLFLTGNDSTNYPTQPGQEIQIIALHKSNNTYLELIRTNCLDFKKCDQIDCIFKVHNGCDIIIYFTDHKNKYKSINLTSIENNTVRYKLQGYTNYLGGDNPNIPTVDPSIGVGTYGWACDQFFLSPVSEHPDLLFHKLDKIGNLRVGTYTFFIRLLDEDLNPTDWLTWTNPITVKQGDFNAASPPDNTDGYYESVTVENFVSKSITLILENLDQSFNYYEIGVMERSLNTNLPTFAYRTGQRLIPGSSGTFLFNDVNDTRLIEYPVSSLLVKNRKIDVVQAHAQINNRLLVGNLTSTVRDWSKFQQKANNIKIEYFTYNDVTIADECGTKKHYVASGEEPLKALQAANPGTYDDYEVVNYSSPEFLSYGMSLMRDEVYALGIIYVFNDGSESPVFHIPGRPKFSTTTSTGIVDTYDIDGFDYAEYATQHILSWSSLASTATGGIDQRTFEFNNPLTTGGLSALSPTDRLSDFDNQVLNVNYPHNLNGSWESTHLTNLTQYNRATDTASIATDEYKYLYGFKDIVTCCYTIPFAANSCQGNEIERWQYYNTAIRRKSVTGAGSWASIDAMNTYNNNPYYTFTGGFSGIPGYFDTNIPYPDIKDCEGNRIYPEGNVRHHKMPDHRIEQLFDRVAYQQNVDFTGNPSNWSNFPDVDGTLGQGASTGLAGGGWLWADTVPTTWAATYPDQTWADDSNINDFNSGFLPGPLGLFTPLNTLLISTNAPEHKKWSMNNSEGSLKLYPLGLRVLEVEIPTEYVNNVTGYYIVRSNRTNNKTVIDKGFFNVCDTSVSTGEWDTGGNSWGREAVDDFGQLETNSVWPNVLFLTPEIKPGTEANGIGFYNKKQPIHTWWNILEIHTPKSTMNDPVTLSVDYLKPEATVFGDMFFDSNKPPCTVDFAYCNTYTQQFWDGGSEPLGSWDPYSTIPAEEYAYRVWLGGYNVGASVFLNRHKYPRVASPLNRTWWTFIYNIPISGLAYANFNNEFQSNSLGQGSTTIKNNDYRQRTLIARYKQSCTSVEPTSNFDTDAQLNSLDAGFETAGPGIYDVFSNRSVCDLSFPYQYSMLKRDIQDHSNTNNLIFNGRGKPLNTLDTIIIDSRVAGTDNIGVQNSWSKDTVVTDNYKWSIGTSPYMYYGALKSSATPYQDFDNITYIKMHSYQIPKSYTDFVVTGGDTFINRFQFEKGFYKPNDEDKIGFDNTIKKFLTSTTVGYVESEINSAFRHLIQGDLFRSFPFSNRDAYYGFLTVIETLLDNTASREDLDNLMNPQEIFNRYKIDYSSYNTEIPSFQLPSTFDYCSSCSESFPNTLFYSEVSLDSQVQDFYKLFLTNSFKAIPSYTGEIQNMFVKNSDLYVHTEHNLWKISVAPQTMQTNADTVEVGQGEFLGREPIKLFNNEDAYSRGGTIDKFTSVFAMGDYIWLDRNSGSVLKLGNGIKSISDLGMSKWFSENSEVTLDTQFRNLTGLPYPYKGTSCNTNVGYIATIDAEHDRYILTKKDYELLPSVTSDAPTALRELTTNPDGTLYVPNVVVGYYYYDNDGFYVGIQAGVDVSLKDQLLAPIDYTDKTLAKNKSWTLSYSLKSEVWSSFHSYIPNWLYYDSRTFYSFVANPTDDINLSTWEHNYGEFQTYYNTKFDFIIDYIYKKNPYAEKTFDSIEYTSNVWSKSTVDDRDIEIPFTTFDRFFVYNNNQLSNLKEIDVSNLIPYASTLYDITKATAHKWRNMWKINRLRDLTVNRLNLNEPKFTKDWSELTYQNEYDNGFGYIDKVINPSIIDINKDVYQIERLTDKYLGVRLFFKPLNDYKITLNLITGEKRNKV